MPSGLSVVTGAAGVRQMDTSLVLLLRSPRYKNGGLLLKISALRGNYWPHGGLTLNPPRAGEPGPVAP
jgi:hypothetical protein